jgi:restriction system protein
MEAEAAFLTAHAVWQEAVDVLKQEYQAAVERHATEVRSQEEAHKAALDRWEEEAAAFVERQNQQNNLVDRRRELYPEKEREAVEFACCGVLTNSQYPDYFPKSFELEYNPANNILVVDYQLPTPADIPDLTETRYAAASDASVEKRLPQKEVERLYDSVLYQVALRTMRELFAADEVGALEAVVFNGWVHSTDPATGGETRSCVLTLQAGRGEFLALNLAAVEPKACFKGLRGVGSSKLHSLAAVPPLITMSRQDSRFVASQAVADRLAEGENLAAMDWEDFEHLIRELFEWEFAANGAEVKVTQASRDGGVDAVIFDPDPLHGGKTVVQAKRYTNTVGVGAVRDLYGTMINEGANRGILVTTSDYGPDAYAFQKGKPLVLLSGSNLLHLLERHGRKAKIDLLEAKRMLGE